jgi:hypothetical protein
MPSERFELGPALLRTCHVQRYQLGADAPQFGTPRFPPPPQVRRLNVFTQDPTTVRADVNVVRVAVPYEPLAPGPDGAVVRVIDINTTVGRRYQALDLDQLYPGYEAGLQPSTTDPCFAQQMTYGLAMATFERFRLALGRVPDFAFLPHREDDSPNGTPVLKLHIHPHAQEEANAYYDPVSGSLRFGYTFSGAKARGLNQPGGVVFTSLSHDVVIHEMTHALLDGLRTYFLVPTNPDVAAFHEGFADLVSLFQRFQYRDLLLRAFEESPDALTSGLLTEIARQFGQAATGKEGALRTALLDAGGPTKAVDEQHLYHPEKEEHELGGVLVAAVFDAFRWIFEKKTKQLRRLASKYAAQESREYIELLASEAGLLGSQFTNVIIRAIDYCPPVDITFGEYLRALITADSDLVPDDPWCYREALVQGFRRYGVTVDGVPDLSEEALVWRPPEGDSLVEGGLAFDQLRFGREVGEAAERPELERRGELVGRMATKRGYTFGLVPWTPRSAGVEKPVVQSVRSLRRIGPDGEVNFDLVAEVTQRRRLAGGGYMYGGSTIVIDSRGKVRYAIAKNVGSKRRLEQLETFISKDPVPRREWLSGSPGAAGRFLRALHSHREMGLAGGQS